MNCDRCGSPVSEEDRFCGVCGARSPATAQEAAPTRQIPLRAPYPPVPPYRSGRNNRTIATIIGFGVMLLVVAGIGAAVGFTGLGSKYIQDDSTPNKQADAPAPGNPTSSNSPKTVVVDRGGVSVSDTNPTGSGTAQNATGVAPSSVTASSISSPAPDASGNTITYDPQNAVDGRDDTAWNVDGSGVGESITLSYDEPVTVDRVGIIPGYDKTDPTDGTNRFYQLHVIKSAQIGFSDGSTVEANFDRDPSVQFADVPRTATHTVKITILDSYPPSKTSPQGDVYPYTLDKTAISEIEVEGP